MPRIKGEQPHDFLGHKLEAARAATQTKGSEHNLER